MKKEDNAPVVEDPFYVHKMKKMRNEDGID